MVFVSEKQVDFFGNTISKWANEKHCMVKINGKEITRIYPSSSGYDNVLWDSPLLPEPLLQKKNLKEIIEKSTCKIQELEDFFKKLNEPNQNLKSMSQKGGTGTLKELEDSLGSNQYMKSLSQTEFAKKLSCLGKIELKPLSFSSD